jgi:hypothetical protein
VPLLLYEHLRNTVTTHLEIDEVITGASLSTGTSPTAKNTTPLNSGINLEKCEHLCQIDDLNPGVRFHYKEPKQLTFQKNNS